MIKTTLPIKHAVSEIVQAYRILQGRNGRPATLRSFSDALSDVLQFHGGSISHQSVKNWEDRVHLPHSFYMMQIALHAPIDWRRDFAQDILAALHPSLYKPATEIGTRAVERNNTQDSFSKNGGRKKFRSTF
jgi:hypothetical protein